MYGRKMNLKHIYMECYDISRNLSDCDLYPGTIPPRLRKLSDCEEGDEFNLSILEADLHTGTHVDAPLHFISNAKDVASLDLTYFVGPCLVISEWDKPEDLYAPILLLRQKNQAPLSLEDCLRFQQAGVRTLGTDALSLASPHTEGIIHRFLLEKDMAIIENLFLDEVPDGPYFLSAAPIKIGGAEAAFCRAILIKHVNFD